jgi:hypothetical protein
VTETMLPATTQSTDEKRGIALLKAIGLDRVQPEQRELALAIADRYALDLMLKHLVLIEGKPYITRDGLLHIAHRSGVFDGIDVTPPVKVDRYWRSTCSVFRKDMTRPFTYPGRFPVGAKNDEEMAVKVAESMALRRAFDVSAATVDERWANDDEPVDAPEPTPRPSLADLAHARAQAVAQAEPEPTFDPSDGASVDPVPDAASTTCGSTAPNGLMAGAVCILDPDHKGAHKSDDGSWPQ